MKRVELPFTHPDPQVANLHRDLVAAVNDDSAMTLMVTTPKVADTEFPVIHRGLGRIATEIHIVMQDVPGRIYRSSASKWSSDVSFLKYDQAGGHRITVRVK